MSDDRRSPPGFEGPDDETVDPGPPIEALSRLREEPSSVFGMRVMESINRRILGVQALDIPAWGFTRLLLAYVQLLMSLLGIKDEDDLKEN